MINLFSTSGSYVILTNSESPYAKGKWKQITPQGYQQTTHHDKKKVKKPRCYFDRVRHLEFLCGAYVKLKKSLHF